MIKIAIPTHWRSKTIIEDTLKIVKQFNKDTFEIYIFPNPIEETEKYTHLGSDNIYVVWLPTKWILQTRNQILEYFNEWDEIFFMDDDITWAFIWYNKNNKWVKQDLSINQIEQAITKWFKDIKEKGLKLFWFYPVQNAFFMSKTIKVNQFIIASAFGMIKTDLKFDENLPLKEDYDFTIQNYIKYGWAIRYNYITFKAKHYTNAWWCQTERNDNREKISCDYLKQKWWDFIKENPKRENEILLNLK